MPLVFNFHPALSGIGRIIESLLPILYASVYMKKLSLSEETYGCLQETT